MDKARGPGQDTPTGSIKTAPTDVMAHRIYDRVAPGEHNCSRDIPNPATNGPHSIYPPVQMSTEESKGNH